VVNTIKFSQFANADLNSSLNSLVGTSSLVGGGINIKSSFTTKWTTATRPTSPPDGLLGYNTTLEKYEYWNALSSLWIPLESGGSGTVNLVNSGTGLTGGPITTTGTLSFSPILANSLWVNTSNVTAVPIVTPLSNFLLSANNLSDISSVPDAVSNLGLTIGFDVQAWSHNLDEISANILPGSVQATVNSYNSGTGASTSTFLRGDGTWSAPSGSGSVNPGLINELSYYASSGNAVSGLVTVNNGVLITNGSGQPSISTTLPTSLNIPQPSIVGIVDGSNALPGIVGEFISSIVTSPITFVSNVAANLTFITLSPGDWDVYGNIFCLTGLALSFYSCGISTISSTLSSNAFTTVMYTQPANSASLTAPFQRINVTTNTNVFIVGRIIGTGTLSCSGGIYARRAR